MLDRRELPP
ncbi:hypothetical protein Egran_04323, partial [Elaphomyces granulatus]